MSTACPVGTHSGGVRDGELRPDSTQLEHSPARLRRCAQDEVGAVNDAVIAEIARRIEISELDVRNVISYYSLLHTKPHGKYHVQVCTNISCMLRGGNEMLQHCKDRLGIGNKETTPDGVFSLEEVECIGVCCWAPAVQVNYDFHDNLTNEKMDAVLESYRQKASNR